MTCASFPTVTGVILAGGQARRMGGQDKGLLLYQQQPLIAHVIQALAPQVDALLINANRNQPQYQQLGYPVFSDQLDGFQGPLSGMLSGMMQANTDYILTAPCDCPQISSLLRRRLLEALLLQQADIAVAHDGQRMQPVFALIPCRLQADLQQFLASGERKIDRWLQQHRLIEVDFSDQPDSFINCNYPEDLEIQPAVTAPVPMLGFAAFSGTGKTTLLTQLIPRLTAKGLRLAVVKHAHHNFDIDKPGKDSYQLREAGASQVLVASSRLLALMQRQPEGRTEPVLAECLPRLDMQQLDLILVEGFKQEYFAKIELHRPSLGKPLLHPDDPSIVAIASDQPLQLDKPLPQLDLNDIDAITAFICKFCQPPRRQETAHHD